MTPTRPLACIRLHATLSAGACATRYEQAKQRFPPTALLACRGCPAGERVAELLPVAALKVRRQGESFRLYGIHGAPWVPTPDRVTR